MEKYPKHILSHGQAKLESSVNMDLAGVGTFYKLAGTYQNGNIRKFVLDTAGKLTFTGPNNSSFLFNGASDISVNKPCQLTYGLYLNGVLLPGAETPHTFAASSKISNISITSIITLNKGDYLNVYAKSTTANTTLTIHSFIVTLLGTKA